MSDAHGGGGLTLPGLSAIQHLTHSLHAKNGVGIPHMPIMAVFAGSILLFFLFEPLQSIRNFQFVLFLSPLWIAPLLARFAWGRWVEMVRYDYNVQQDWILLEIQMPRDTRKSPLAMEAFFSNIHLAPGEGTWYKKFWLGRTRPWYSMEIVSLGGRVHFYIWTRKPFRHVIETYLYAQYPGVAVVEATDYTRLIDPTHAPYQMWGCEYEKKSADPVPIKTYVEFGLDKIAKPEETTDPLSQVVEFMGSLSPNEQLWIHIIIRYSKGEKYGGKRNAQGKRYTWVDEGLEIIEDIRQSTVKKVSYTDAMTGEKRETEGFPNPTKGQMEAMAAIGRNTSKLCFDVGMRAVYVAKEGHFRDYIGNFVTQIFRPFASADQQIAPQSLWSEEFQDFPWEDPKKVKYNEEMHHLLEFTRRRAYFHAPYIGPYTQMSTEELASIYHIPSSTTTAPNLPRIQSNTVDAPSNLPT